MTTMDVVRTHIIELRDAKNAVKGSNKDARHSSAAGRELLP